MCAPSVCHSQVPPRETIYVNNLNERINLEELKKSLYAAFSQFGPILDVVCLKSFRMRGQAFVVFRDLTSATTAVRQMQGFPFYDKPMQITFAKTKSDATMKLEGTYEMTDKLKGERAAKRKAEREARDAKASEKKAKDAGGAGGSGDAAAAGGSGDAPSLEKAPPGGAAAASAVPAEALPNPILFVENLPEQATEMMLSMLFQQFPGYKEVRLVPGKAGIAFVEFDGEMQSGVAMAGLQNFRITPQKSMKISYRKH